VRSTNHAAAVIDRKARYSLIIEILAYPPAFEAPVSGVPVGKEAMPFGTEKLEWWGYPMMKKILIICLFVLTQLTNVTDGRTDRQTDRHRMMARVVLDGRAAKIGKGSKTGYQISYKC